MVDPKKLREDYDFDEVTYSVVDAKFYIYKDMRRAREAEHHEIYDCWAFDQSKERDEIRNQLKEELKSKIVKLIDKT